MAIEKINGLNPINLKVPFKGSAEEKVKPAEADSEKSNAMKYMVGLGAAAALVIGGIMYARRGKAPKGSEKVIEAATSSSATHSGSTTSAGFVPVKNFMRKFADGTEVLAKTEERDVNGNLLKTTLYRNDGKTVKCVKEYATIPAGVVDKSYPETLSSVICYGKNGDIIHQLKMRDDCSGFDVVSRCLDGKYVIEDSYKYVTEDGKLKSQSISSLFKDAETSQKRFEVEFAPKGQKGCDIEFDGWDFRGIGKAKMYDKKTGKKCVKEVTFLGEGRKMEILYGEGFSKTRIITDADGNIESQYWHGKDGKMRKIYLQMDDGSYQTTIYDRKGGYKIVDGNGKLVANVYQKGGHTYTQNFHDEPTGNYISTYRDEVPVGTTSLKPYKKNVFTDEHGITSSLLYDTNGKKLSKSVNQGDKISEYVISYYPNGNFKKLRYSDGHHVMYFNEKNPEDYLEIVRSPNGRVEKIHRSALPNREGKAVVFGPSQLGWTDVKEGQKAIGYYGYNQFSRLPRSVDVYENGRLIQKGNSQITYLDDGKIVEENLREDYKFVYQNDFEHPIERYSREYDRENGYHWVKMPLEI